MSSNIKEVTSNTSVKAKQITSSLVTPYNPGDMAVVFDYALGEILGRSEVISSSGYNPLTINLKTPIERMNTNCFIWNESSANPNTVLRRVKTSRKANRFQTSVTIDQCELTGLSYFQSTELEGPIPSNVVVKNSILKQGVGSADYAFKTSSTFKIDGNTSTPQYQPFTNYLFQNNEFYGGVDLGYMENVTFINNTFKDANKGLSITDSRNCLVRDNKIGRIPLDNESQITFADHLSEESTLVELSENKTKIAIIQPFLHWQGHSVDSKVFSYNALVDSIKPTFVDNVQLQDSNYSCYRIVLPTSGIIERISMELFPQAESETVSFWSYLNENETGEITAIAVDSLGVETEVYSESLSGGDFHKHTINIPSNYYDKRSAFKIYFKTNDNGAFRMLYIGTSEIQTPLQVESHSSDNDPFFTISGNEHLLELAVSKIGGHLIGYDLMGRTIYSQYITDTKTIISKQELEASRMMIFQYTVDGYIYRKKCLH